MRFLAISIVHFSVLAASLAQAPRPGSSVAADPVQFNRDVRPILANHCFACHGPDSGSRKASLRLDTRAGTIADRKSGPAVVPGDAAASLLIQRVHHADPKKRMPPAGKSEALTDAQVDVLRRWIDTGANWQAHWAYEAIAPRPVPAIEPARVRNDVDRWHQARLAKIGVTSSPPASPRTLIRRLHMDLVGLPPESADVAAFVADPSEANYERTVDRLLASEHHAERLTMYWLDLVRYADSCGIHGDQEVSMSPYRDWVIRAFQENMPFDRFTREQLAGDLVADASISSRTASAYNRLNMKTAEGGAQPAEYLAKYAADRVRTTATVWLGSTLGCAECHDHKFDPFTTRDFYQFAAFFADLDHEGFYGGAKWRPKMAVPTATEASELASLTERIAKLETNLAAQTPKLTIARRLWEAATLRSLAEKSPPVFGPWSMAGPYAKASHRAAFDAVLPPERTADAAPSADDGPSWQPRPEWKDGVTHKLRGGNSATYLHREVESSRSQVINIELGTDDAVKVWLNGVSILEKFVARGVQPGQEKLRLSLRKGRNQLLIKVTNGGGGYGFHFQVAGSGPPLAVVEGIREPEGDRTVAQQSTVESHFRSIAPELAAVRQELATARKQRAVLEGRLRTVLVSKARATPRVTRVLPRGNWQDLSGEVVSPGVPGFLAAGHAPTPSRLDLANWILAQENPLTARVFVNRLWKLCFGAGLCSTLDDLGSQGDRPRQAELLDWLASEFRRDWNVRRVLKLIVMSAAYRQSSAVSAEARERDPDNREFARQGRFRIDAELVRDQALAVSGLLHPVVGGPSVKPYQPAGYWRELNFPKREWVHDKGLSQYRRGLYTHWQRTFLHPSMRAFDAPSREECTADRPRSNTPLQALALLNDPTYVEAARVFAARMIRRGGATFESRVQSGFQWLLGRDPSAQELRPLRSLLHQQRRRYEADPEAANALVRVGLAPKADGLESSELAAWVAVARVLLNLHEAITRY